MESEVSGLDSIFFTFDQIFRSVVDYLPTLGSAGALLVAGVAVAWVLKIIVLRISDALATLIRRARGGKPTRPVRLPWPISVIVANLIYGLTVLYFLSVSSRILGLEGIADWITAAAAYLPVVLLVSAIVLGGYVLASIARDAIARPGYQSQALASLAFFAINTIAILAALRQFGIDLLLVRSLILIAAAAAFGGIAFAFGKGASASLANIIAAHYVRRVYRLGQRVRIGPVEGDILEITPTAVVVDTESGRAMIPATKFNEDISVLLGSEGASDGT